MWCENVDVFSLISVVQDLKNIYMSVGFLLCFKPRLSDVFASFKVWCEIGIHFHKIFYELDVNILEVVFKKSMKNCIV